MSSVALFAAPSALAYQWPVKPFQRQHPIRGAFGDPRTLRGKIDITFDNPVSFHAGAGHVHLSERRFGVYVNPLRRGGLAPYADHTYPVIRGLIVYAAATDRELPLDAVTGRVDIAVDAYDPPAIAPWGEWSDAVWSPAHITWSGLLDFDSAWMPRSGPGQTVDFDRLPHVALRDVYAPGTVQNRPNLMADERFWLVRGLDTSDLVGDHTITVTAWDTRGNRTTRSLGLTVIG